MEDSESQFSYCWRRRLQTSKWRGDVRMTRGTGLEWEA